MKTYNSVFFVVDGKFPRIPSNVLCAQCVRHENHPKGRPMMTIAMCKNQTGWILKRAPSMKTMNNSNQACRMSGSMYTCGLPDDWTILFLNQTIFSWHAPLGRFGFCRHLDLLARGKDGNSLSIEWILFLDTFFWIHLSSITSIIRLLLKPDKSVHITKSFPSLSFVASLPVVFTSPHVNSRKESRFLISHHLSPEFSSDDGDEGKTSLGVSDALHLPSSSADTQGRCDIKSSMEEFNVEALEAS